MGREDPLPGDWVRVFPKADLPDGPAPAPLRHAPIPGEGATVAVFPGKVRARPGATDAFPPGESMPHGRISATGIRPTSMPSITSGTRRPGLKIRRDT